MTTVQLTQHKTCKNIHLLLTSKHTVMFPAPLSVTGCLLYYFYHFPSRIQHTSSRNGVVSFLCYIVYFVARQRQQRRSCWRWSVRNANTGSSWPSSGVSTSSWEETRRRRFVFLFLSPYSSSSVCWQRNMTENDKMQCLKSSCAWWDIHVIFSHRLKTSTR